MLREKYARNTGSIVTQSGNISRFTFFLSLRAIFFATFSRIQAPSRASPLSLIYQGNQGKPDCLRRAGILSFEHRDLRAARPALVFRANMIGIQDNCCEWTYDDVASCHRLAAESRIVKPAAHEKFSRAIEVPRAYRRRLNELT